ncbi:MAG TPA: PH domain-containing protein [Streptosporangiaceae bacterium]|nr:PH domain-containing protein [Streptosporangiaceae bacterium]
MTAPLPDELPLHPVAAATDQPWHRLHPLSPLVRAGRQLMSLVVLLAGIVVANHHRVGGDLVTDLVIIAIALTGGFVSWLVTRWQIADGVLRVDTGLIRRDSRRFPLSQIQAVDVVQTGLARVLGLAELRLRMAGGDAAHGGRLACLRRGDAEQLRRDLLALSAAVAAGSVRESGRADKAVVPERVLFRVNSARLPVAILLSRSGAIAVAVAGAAGLTIAISGRTSTIAPFLPFVLGVMVNLWRQLNGEYATTIAAAPDGLRLRSGLIQTTAETIRPGRIQAVRLAEPLIWRALGWCRLEVDVAGARQRREDQGEGRRLRAVIPVGSRAEAGRLLAELIGSQPVLPGLAPPPPARWKAPLTYHFLGWNRDDRYVVASRGRVCRETTWVPLDKVQSIRWVQGPLQRRLRLATVDLDVAGKRVSAKIQDRSDAEAMEILARLPDLARAARLLAA